MALSVVMPALEMAQETGKLVSWLKKEGDSVCKGEPLLEIETDKAVMEIEAPGDGVLSGIKVFAGAEVPVGQTIAWIVRPGEAPPGEEARVETGRKTTRASAAVTASAVSSVAPAAGKPIRISPRPAASLPRSGSTCRGCRDRGPREKFSLTIF